MTEPQQSLPALVPAEVDIPVDATWEQREAIYRALLDLAEQFTVPCRPGGILADITVARRRKGPTEPYRWAIHRIGRGFATYAWNGSDWTVLYDRADLHAHALWPNALPAVLEATRVARAEVDAARPDLEDR